MNNPPPMRPLAELLATNEPAWPMVQEWIRSAKRPVDVLPPRSPDREEALFDSQVTIRSPMGAIVYESGGLFIDDGWLRVLGSGHPRFPRTLPDWNRGRSTSADGRSLGFWLIADDVVGGFFALDGGALGPGKGHVYYFAPDSLRWEPMNEMGYGQFLVWAFQGDLQRYYESMRWPGWETEVAAISGDKALSIYPFLWSKEGRDVGKASRRPVPISEVYDLNVVEFPKQLGQYSPGLKNPRPGGSLFPSGD